MCRTAVTWTTITSAAIALLANLRNSSSNVPSNKMNSSSTGPTRRQTGWLKGGIARFLTGLGIVATVAASGNQSWAVGTDPGTPSVIAFQTAPAPVRRVRRPHLIATKAGHDHRQFWPKVDSSNVTTYAARYDMIFGDIPGELIGTMRSINPGIILLEYSLPGGTQRIGQYPDSYYVKDAISKLKVGRNAWWLLNFRDPAVRKSRLNDVLSAAPDGVDGHFLDVSDANWLSSPFGNQWQDENGKVADISDLDGGWNPTLPRADKPKFADGTWPPRMLEFIKELTAAAPGKRIIFNGLFGGVVLNANPAWAIYEENWLNNTHGVAKEGIFVTSNGYPLSESEWKWWLGKAKRVIDQGKYMHFLPLVGSDLNLLRYAFASYLLIADGKYAWFNDQWPSRYDSSLYDVDYGAPLGPYQVIDTVAGPIYKRQFANATVWVNPGNVTRTGDGRTVGPKRATIEVSQTSSSPR